ncbi:DUF3309 domain-containing protein [Granulicella sp. L46]|uniref:DUF3309 domain-containing protein n=1 Tax=Granulicella sp. L46 TaxID=1641865 RepID=UPI00131CFCEF|nr:DUF3309 domain-containing protein [Granulicella sp. L46]
MAKFFPVFCLDNRNKRKSIYIEVASQSLWRHVVLIVIIILLLLVFGSFPSYPYSRNWGYYPAGGLGTILLIVVILWLLHVI